MQPIWTDSDPLGTVVRQSGSVLEIIIEYPIGSDNKGNKDAREVINDILTNCEFINPR